MNNKDLKRRIIEISWKHKLSHLGSCLSAVDIINEIYSIKKPDEKFILSSGHAGLALYCVIEKYEGLDAEKIFEHHGVHPDRCADCHLYYSTGSLGQGLPAAVGIALADRKKNVWCLISDGECSEGSIWEALRIKEEQGLTNLIVYVNINGWGAYKEISRIGLQRRFTMFTGDPFFLEERLTYMNDYPEWLQRQQAHYLTLNEDQYKEILSGILGAGV